MAGKFHSLKEKCYVHFARQQNQHDDYMTLHDMEGCKDIGFMVLDYGSVVSFCNKNVED
jgi:hypothetical protein